MAGEGFSEELAESYMGKRGQRRSGLAISVLRAPGKGSLEKHNEDPAGCREGSHLADVRIC